MERGERAYKGTMNLGGDDDDGLTRNEINSLTHSCTHSFASFAILALSGRAAFMIRPTFAICSSGCGAGREGKAWAGGGRGREQRREQWRKR